MRIRLSARDPDGFSRDVAVDATPGATLAEVSTHLTAVLPVPPRPGGGPELWSGSRRLPSSALLGGPGLCEGAIVHVGQAGERDPAAGAVLRLHVVGGPDAGLVSPLPRGVMTVGRSPTCEVTLTDPDVSRQHAAITVTTAGITVRDLGSTNGTLLDGSPVDPDGALVQPGELLRLGDSLLCVGAADEPAAAVRAGADGVRLVNRPPRLSVRLPDREIVAPTRPPSSGPQRIQWLAAVLPAAAGVALALTMHSIQFLAFALLSPVVMIGTAAGDRFHWSRERRREARGFGKRDAATKRERAELLAAETVQRRRAHPDPAAVLRTATIPDCRLWERRRGDPDALEVRLGLADSPSSLRTRCGTQSEPAGMVPMVPVTLPLRLGPLGIAGPRGIALGAARWAVAQLAALHSPADLRLVLLLSDAASPAWTWSRWLPHLDGNVAIDAEGHSAAIAELARLVDERLPAGELSQRSWSGPWTLLVVDRAGALADNPGLARVLAAGPAVGISAICLDDEERRLPTSCAAVARVCGETGTRLHIRTTTDVYDDVVTDRVGTRFAERVARALAPLADASADASTSIPRSCRLLDLLEMSHPSPDELITRWQADERPGTLLGAAADGAFDVDLVRDGPHALVAGTTGAGKSELLQSLVAGLAVMNSPAAMAFVLIDYKGGAAFADCARLPHAVGLVTDLDEHLTRRALQSLDAELRRREALFAAAGAKDLSAYRASPQQCADPLGRLVLVVDEFAALVEELPDFVVGLVALAQRGRSLGVHLVLATQRPGGVVSPEIRANTSLRISLRVTDPAESSDIVGTDAAAAIDKHRPGRAYVRTGATLTEIQTALVGGIAPTGTQTAVTPLDQWGRAPRDHDVEQTGKTDLQVLVDAAREAALRCGVASQRRPWLAPLPRLLPAAELDDPSSPAMIPLGLRDLPHEQRQITTCLDLQLAGPILVVGGPRSGRSGVLRSLAVNAAARLAPDDVHIYVADCATGALRQLRELPHCGTVAARDDFGVAERVLARLTAEIARRHELLADLGVGSIAEARGQGERIPFIMLLIDGWEGFVAAADEHDAGRSVDLLLALLRESAAAGVTVALTGERSALAARVASSIARKYLLRLADSGDYALAGISPRAVPDLMPPGRAICADDATEMQFAFLGRNPSLAEQHRQLAHVASAAPLPSGRHAPFEIRPLPSRIALASLDRASSPTMVLNTGGQPAICPTAILGVGGDAALAVDVDLFAGDARMIVAGPTRSGRTTTLQVILEQIPQTVEVLVAAPRRSALSTSARLRDIKVIAPDDPVTDLRPAGQRPLLVLVDDSEAFLDTPVGDALTTLVRPGARAVAAIVAARNEELAVTYRGVANEVRRSRCGLVLQPGPGDGELLGVRLPRTQSAQLPGRGVLVLDDQQPHGAVGPLPIQVALPRQAVIRPPQPTLPRPATLP